MAFATARALATLGFLGLASAASAADALPQTPMATIPKLDCTFTTALNSRPLFLNAGIYASRTPAQTSDINCPFDNGYYFNVWTLAPYGRDFGDGGEIDFRGGWTKTFGPVGVDISAAWFNFRIDGIGVLNTANLRGKGFYNITPAGSRVILQTYGLFDYQHSFDFHPSEAFALAGGAYAGYMVTPKFKVGVGAEVWKYFTHFAPNKTAVIYSLTPQAEYSFTDKVTLFTRVGFASGNVTNALDHGWKHSVMFGASFKLY